jgi:hypothetical protein
MISRPNSAPAYYQGRPADLLIAAMSPHRKGTASSLASSAGVAADGLKKS